MDWNAEEVFILTFVLEDHVETIGLLLAAESIFPTWKVEAKQNRTSYRDQVTFLYVNECRIGDRFSGETIWIRSKI